MLCPHAQYISVHVQYISWRYNDGGGGALPTQIKYGGGGGGSCPPCSYSPAMNQIKARLRNIVRMNIPVLKHRDVHPHNVL